MKNYRVMWEINIDAVNPKEAAREAMKIQQNPRSGATIFKVRNSDNMVTSIDLWNDQRLACERKKEVGEVLPPNIMGCCDTPQVKDLTQGLGETRHYYCMNCQSHIYAGRRWTAQEWFDEYQVD